MTILIVLLFLSSSLGGGNLLVSNSINIPKTKAYSSLDEQTSLPGTCSIEILPNAFYTTSTSCSSDSNGLILFDIAALINGTPPYSFDWDDLNTPQNDTFNDDGYYSIDSLPAGSYALIVTDASGCSTSGSEIIEEPVIYATTLIDSLGLCEFYGGIEISSFEGPAGFLNFNWDFANTPFDDDFGTGNYDMGFLPEENDQEDLAEGLQGGVYFLEITIVYDSLYQAQNCIWRDTFNIFIDSLRLFCPSGDAFLYAGTADTTFSYQWQVDSLNGFEVLNPDAHHSGTTNPFLHILDMPSSWQGYQYRCRLTQGIDTSFSVPFPLRFGACSDGSSSSWHNPSAWHCNAVPDINTDVFVTDQNGALIVLVEAFCRSLTLLPGSILRIFPSGTLTIDSDP